jgi:glycosyltransferase involved in cell wall biosynthesis
MYQSFPANYKMREFDFLFLSNTCHFHDQDRKLLTEAGIPYSVITFHEDFLKYWTPCMGMYQYILQSLRGGVDGTFRFTVDRLLENPNLIYYYGNDPNRMPVYNYDFLKEADMCVVSSEPEADTLRRDCPPANVKKVYWAPGFAEGWETSGNTDFLKLTGLKKHEYLLQVGRLETRKNQFSTVLATRDIDVPLVFVATASQQPDYEKAVGDLAKTYRKAPTIIVSETYGDQDMGNVKIIQMPAGKKLTRDMLKSAYENCAMNVHPAFYELPGLTYLEALKLNRPCVASDWCAVTDYLNEFDNDPTYGGMMRYSDPHDFAGIQKNVEYFLNNPVTGPWKFASSKILDRTEADVGADYLKILNER